MPCCLQPGRCVCNFLTVPTHTGSNACIMEHQAHIFCFVTLTLLLFGVLNVPLCPHSSNRGNYTTHRTHAVFSHPDGNATMVILEVAKHRAGTDSLGSGSSQLLLAWEQAQQALNSPRNHVLYATHLCTASSPLCGWDGAWWDALEWWKLQRGARTWQDAGLRCKWGKVMVMASTTRLHCFQ